ncbi:MAG: DNA polymerase/3'-5' exonuclease PolX [Patescibacteria group bacterium]|nr:DNA polymerase/3'-5' exonuclease PolX [Patescibacteria group bacterium]MCL5224068.1 DNA polymerase/3'-5' exonuclease PolX [Patescibacteria group bacterium]
MRNEEIAKTLAAIGSFLEMDEVAFKPRAYARAAEAISNLEEETSEIYKKGGIKALEEIPGVGASIAEKIEELLKTGKLQYYEDLKKKHPINVAELSSIEGLGPKTMQLLYKKLGVKNLAGLEKAVKDGKIRKLPRFGQKSEEKIEKGIEAYHRHSGRFPIGEVAGLAESIKDMLWKVPGVSRVDIAGSFRRRKETVGDLDMLVISTRPKAVMDAFISQPDVIEVIAHGNTKSSVRLKIGIDVDLRVVNAESYGAALAYFTGSKPHNVAMRQMAQDKGWKLNEYGLFRKSGKGWIGLAGKTEEEIYEKLGLEYVPPEMREDLGELDLAAVHKLPRLIGYKDLVGDLQVQSNWTDGANSIEEMALAAEKMGYKYVAITDHTKRLAMAHGLDEAGLAKQGVEIDRVNKKLKGRIKVLKGTECDVLKDGTLDISDKTLAKLDIVGVSIHSYFDLPLKEQTARLERAMRNPNADIVFHPTCRLINKREPISIDMDRVIKVAKETGMVLEIDGIPDRLDLKDEYIRKAVEVGVKLSVDSDAHAIAHLPFASYGLAQARRGWAKRSDIVNTWPLERMKKMLKS